MPTYSYRCPRCGATAERKVPVSMRDQGPLCWCGRHVGEEPVRMERVVEAPAVNTWGHRAAG